MTIPGRSSGRGSVCLLFLCGILRVGAQITESPQTVAPGKLLIEMDGLTLGFDRKSGDGNVYTAVGVASTIVTAGLTQAVDLQVGFNLFLRETYEIGGDRKSDSGLGDLFFRTKWTFWRDDGIGAAAAVIPYVTVPSNKDGVGRDSMEGGLIVPWAMDVGAGLKAGAMFRWDVLRNDADNGYDSRWNVSGFVRRNLTSTIGLYGETTATVASTGLSDWFATIGAGALWQITKRTQIDYELTRGLNRRATDWVHVLRVNWEW